MGAWENAKPIPKETLPQTFTVEVPFGKYRICNKDFVKEARLSEAGHTLLKLSNGAYVRLVE
jgi:hypothetical protein